MTNSGRGRSNYPQRTSGSAKKKGNKRTTSFQPTDDMLRIATTKLKRVVSTCGSNMEYDCRPAEVYKHLAYRVRASRNELGRGPEFYITLRVAWLAMLDSGVVVAQFDAERTATTVGVPEVEPVRRTHHDKYDDLRNGARFQRPQGALA